VTWKYVKGSSFSLVGCGRAQYSRSPFSLRALLHLLCESALRSMGLRMTPASDRSMRLVALLASNLLSLVEPASGWLTQIEPKPQPEPRPVGPREFPWHASRSSALALNVRNASTRIPSSISFVLWDNHHPCSFTVRAVHENHPQHTLEVAQVIPWQDAWSGIVVDTGDDRVATVRQDGHGPAGWQKR